MHSCDHCGGQTEHPLKCSYCGGSHCGDHRLPENHGCPVLEDAEQSDGLGGEGPSIRDRRGTMGKRVSRVRERDDASPEEAERWWEMEDDGGGRTDVLTCSNCEGSTDRVFDCDECGQSVCPQCEGRHECPDTGGGSGHEHKEESDSGSLSLLGRLRALFR